jgi:transcriptional regulator with XRE-family HTH domain
MKAFATNLRKVRIAHGFTQEQAAKAIEVTEKAYQSYEEGRALPRPDRLWKIASVFWISNLQRFCENENWSQRTNSDKAPKVVVMEEHQRGPYKAKNY